MKSTSMLLSSVDSKQLKSGPLYFPSSRPTRVFHKSNQTLLDAATSILVAYIKHDSACIQYAINITGSGNRQTRVVHKVSNYCYLGKSYGKTMKR